MNSNDFYINEETGSSALLIFSNLWKISFGITLFVIIAIILAGYFLPSNNHKIVFSKIIGYLLFLRFAFHHGYDVGIGIWNIEHNLPFHLCGITSILSIIVMIKYNQKIFEFLALLGIPSAIHSLLTPEFISGHEGYLFYDYYISHGSILFVPLFLSIVFKHKIRIGSWKIVFIKGLWIAAIVGLINAFLKTNYLYLCRPPIVDNPLIIIDTWPFYIPIIISFAFIHILIVYYIFKKLNKVELL